jgi:hypothetical protein
MNVEHLVNEVGWLSTTQVTLDRNLQNQTAHKISHEQNGFEERLMNKLIFAVFAAFVLVSCGGGDGSGQFASSDPMSVDIFRAKPVVAGPSLAAQAVSVVNTTTAGQQELRSISALTDGGYTVAWISEDTTIFIQRYDSTGNKVGGETVVPLHVEPANQAISAAAIRQSSIAVLSDGGVVVAYQIDRPVPETAGAVFPTAISAVYIQRFDADGVQVLPETAVFSRIKVFNPRPSFLVGAQVVPLMDGGFVVAWLDVPTSELGPRAVLFKQRYDSQAQPVGGKVLVSDYTPGCNGSPCEIRNSYTLVADAQGGYTFSVFQSVFPITVVSVIHFDAVDAAKQLVTPRPGAVLLLPLEGDRFVLFTSDSQGAFAQLLDGDGTSVGGPARISSMPVDARELTDGSFVVLWNTNGSLTAQQFDSSGVPMGDLLGIQSGASAPGIAALADSGFALAWSAGGTAGDLDVFTQRFLQVLDETHAALRAKKKACRASAKGMTGQTRKAFMDSCMN